MIRVGIDTGGTFTDAVRLGADGDLQVHKRPTTPRRPARAVLGSLAELAADKPTALVHGTTHATNALLTGRLGRIVFVTTQGFADVLAIGRQERDELYCLEPSPKRPPQPASRIIEVDERIDAEGRVLFALTEREIARVVEAVVAKKPEAIAIGLLHAYRESRHEAELATALRGLRVPVFCSHEVAPEYREYERFTTTWADAALAPVVAPALHELDEEVQACFPGSAEVRIMRSDGGTASASAAAADPVHLALSGPAGGLAAARTLADARGDGAVLTLDMGGTSTDVALLPLGESELAPMNLGGLPLLARGLPVHSVGTGGGSLADWDPGGALCVGPESAGAIPGPACYRRGGQHSTVTDAHLVAGRIHPEAFLGGEFELDSAAAHAALQSLGDVAGLSARQAAVAVLEIASADMERALRRVSLAEGYDARDFHLYAFGGAGGLHAVWVASRLGMKSVVIPPHAGAFSAVGMLSAPARRTLVRTVLSALPSQRDRRVLFTELEERARVELIAEGLVPGVIKIRRVLELRSEGQGGEFAIVEGPRLRERFHAEHERRFGYRREDRPIILVAARLQAEGPSASPWVESRTSVYEAKPFTRGKAVFPESGSRKLQSVDWYRREDL
ncbi:MAG: hydantoinase/oxoprolinase family protein, partial [Planctomycetes bacterium]|nr:hydantoinase/oxoprolinase family protein [Planctomycetota bacterium]